MARLCAVGAVIATLFLVVSCRPPVDEPPGAGDVVGSFFGTYRGNFREANMALLTASLAAAIESAEDVEQRSRVAVKASDFPTDKPLILEGELFSGLYEGFTSYQVVSEALDGDRTTVDVLFTNQHYDISWTDRVELVREDGEWRIDDVRYLDKKTAALGLRDVLRDFEEAAASDPLLNPVKK
jgi:hypothetical protein